VSLNFKYFVSRKIILSEFSKAFVVFPGGFGTLDEYTEILCLIQTKKRARSPIVFVGREFWNGQFDWMKTQLLDKHLINQEDFQALAIVDNLEEFESWATRNLT
jgi:hypothetical protein